MDQEILNKIEEQNKKIEQLTQIVSNIRKYFFIIIWVSIALFVLPLIAAMFIIPAFLSTYLGSLDAII